MPREAATGFETGGGGPTYEREIAAIYFIVMLERKSVLNDPSATIASVSFQVRGENWFTDDILLHLENREQSRVAV